MKNFRKILWVVLAIMCLQVKAQDEPDKTIKDASALWIGYYTKFRVGAKSYYYGEYHIRRKNFAADMSKLYLRFGYTYLLSKKFEVTAGIATPLSWAPDQENPAYDKVIPEFRFWQQALLVDKLYHAKLYHQFRFEQRWKRDYEKDSPYELTYRWRYRFTVYVPLSSTHLNPGTWFAAAYNEIFLQSGPSIKYNYFEDNRLYGGLGYILNKNIQLQVGYMWSFKHDGSPYDYKNTHILRFSIYHNADFYRLRSR